MAAVGSPPFKAVTKTTKCSNCGEACRLEGELWTNTLNIQQWRLPDFCCKRCGRQGSDSPSSYARDLRDAFWAPQNYWCEEGTTAKRELAEGLGLELGVELATHLDDLHDHVVLSFARTMDASSSSAFRALCGAAERDRFPIFDDHLKLWRDELVSRQHKIISELAQVWERYEIPSNHREWVPKATSVVWRPLQNAPLRWIIESLGISADATMWTAPSWLYHGQLQVIRIRSIDEWEATQNLLTVLCHNVQKKLSLEREQTLNDARRALRLQSRTRHERELVERRKVPEIEPAESESAEGKSGRELQRGRICVQVKAEMKRFRYMLQEGGKSLAEIKTETPDFLIWKMAESEQLANEDREILLHPNQWGPGYQNLILSKHFNVSPLRIRDYVTAYNRAKKESAH